MRLRLASITILVAGALVYANSLRGPLVLDDHLTLLENPTLTDWRRLDLVLSPPRELPVAGRPFANLSFAFNYAAGGTAVFGYHLVNLAIHLACALVLFGLVRRTLLVARVPAWLRARDVEVAWAVAVLWAVHPLNSEVVDYITQRTESLMGLCYLTTLYGSVRALDGGRRVWTAVAVAACALGMATKESMVTAPVVVLLLDRAMVFESLGKAWRDRRGLYLGLGATWAVLAVLLWSGPRIHSAGFASGVGSWTYLLNQSVIIVHYLRTALWPDALVVLYGWPAPLTLAEVWPSALVVLALLAAAVVALRAAPLSGALAAAFFILLAPTSSVVPIATEVGAERRMYLPLVPVIALLVVAAHGLVHRVTVRSRAVTVGGIAAVVLVAGALGTATVRRNREYASPLTLAQTALERWPTPMAHQMVGEQLLAAGDREAGVAQLRMALPGSPRAHYTLGVELFNEGRFDEASAELRSFVSLQPLLLDVIAAEVVTAKAEARLGRWADAITAARSALRKAPADSEARGVLADALFQQGAFDEALREYTTYLAARPDDGAALANVGIAHVARGDLDAAIAAFRRAVVIHPRDGDARRNLAMALLDHRDIAAAAVEAREAAALRPDDPVVLDVLGRALALGGQMAAARVQFARALALKPDYADARAHLARIEHLPDAGGASNR